MNPLKMTAGAGLLAFLFGCASPAYDVSVYLSPQLKDVYRVYPSVEIDIVGVDAVSSERMKAMPVDEYFSQGNALRKSLAHMTMRFSENDLLPKRLAPRDNVWDKFAEINSDHVVLLVNLPPHDDPDAGQPPAAQAAAKMAAKNPVAEGRRLEIELEKDSFLNPRRWFGWPSKTFEITPAGVVVRSGTPENAHDPVTVRSIYEK